MQHVVGFVLDFKVLTFTKFFVIADIGVLFGSLFGVSFLAYFSVGFHRFVLLADPFLTLLLFFQCWFISIFLFIFILELVFKLFLFLLNGWLLHFHIWLIHPVVFLVNRFHGLHLTVLTLTLQGSLEFSNLLLAVSHIVDANINIQRALVNG